MSVDKTIALIDDCLLFLDRSNSTAKTSQWTAKRIRQTFVDFFTKEQQHTFVPSSSVVPFNDPTILFANAGMNQFKPIFLNQVSPDSQLAKLKRAANSQKCIRAGGKHNDLEDVGKDTYHHTFFEMLGNWSFGDYFKAEAIDMAWNLLVNVYGLNPDRLYATYFEGNDDVKEDVEAKELWLKYLPPERILPFDAHDNFWEMGDTGPCGPCTEIHYDRIGNRDASKIVNDDKPDVIEIWNLVFIQYNREDDGSLKLLPDKHVDTGMGFERVTSILQDKMSNYDTDVFEPILREISKITNTRPYQGLMGPADADGIDMAYRVIADHIRTLTFAITDGGRPGSDGANYVLRRILRRAVRYGRIKLNAPRDSLFFSQLVDVVVDHFGEAFPELQRKRDRVREVIALEENQFNRTLDAGEKQFKKIARRTKARNSNVISGEDTFKLKSSFGFPPDLTAIIAEEMGMKVDTEGYESCLEASIRIQKAKEANKTVENSFKFLGEQTHYLESNGIPPTDQNPKYNWEPIATRVLAIYDGKTFVQSMDESDQKEGALVGVVLEATSFYGESGGQVGDSGSIQDDSEENMFTVSDSQEYGGYIVHIGQVVLGQLTVGQTYNACVDYDRRRLIAPNHTMTHVLNFALREVLGGECNQRGSVVDDTRARFDFSHDSVLTTDEIVRVQDVCQDAIDAELDVFTKTVPYSKAQQVKALRAMFGEKYPDNVRVVTIGTPLEPALGTPSSDEWFKYSIELCGGTHLANTREARRFIITSQQPVSAGVRRLEAVTFQEADRVQQQGETLIEELETKVANLNDSEIGSLIQEIGRCGDTTLSYYHRNQLNVLYESVVNRNKEAQKEIQKKLKKMAIEEAKTLGAQLKANNAPFIVKRFRVDNEPKSLKEVVKQFAKKSGGCPIFAYSVAEDPNDQKQVIVQATVSKNMSERISAEAWVQQILEVIGGGGGGRAWQFTAVGQNSSQIEQVERLANQFAAERLS